MNDSLNKRLLELVEEYGSSRLLAEIQEVVKESSEENFCTILINEGLHTFPDYLFVGEKYVFYEGSLDLTSEESLKTFIEAKLIHLSLFLRRQKWKKIYLVISGHAAVCMQVKLAVYRITHIETIDWVFDGAGNYLKLEVPMRSIVSTMSSRHRAS